MADRLSLAHISAAAVFAAVGAMWGKLGWMFVLWAACAGLDFLTGCLAAIKNGEWDSAVAHAGIWHKAAMVVVVIVAMLFDLALHEITTVAGVSLPIQGVLVTPLVLSWYIIAEIGSILENAIKMGAQHVPKWLTNGLKLVSDTLEKAGDEAVKERKNGKR
ncbi:MAG: phage holin family protein [Oscillospiraceae bacterium]|nr:phage holin family protein [Oscillospiraceae bacterium]